MKPMISKTIETLLWFLGIAILYTIGFPFAAGMIAGIITMTIVVEVIVYRKLKGVKK